MFPHLFLHWEEIIISYSFWLFFLQQLTHVKIRLPSGSCDFICKTKERKKSFQLLSLLPIDRDREKRFLWIIFALY